MDAAVRAITKIEVTGNRYKAALEEIAAIVEAWSSDRKPSGQKDIEAMYGIGELCAEALGEGE